MKLDINCMPRGLVRLASRVLLALACLGAPAAWADPVSDFWIAVVNDHADEVRQALARRIVTVNATNQATNTPLIEAIKSDSWRVYDLLLKTPGIDLDQRNRVGETALMYLAIKGDVERMKVLIDKGAQVNQTGWTALHYAATSGHDDAVRLLLDNYAYIDAEAPGKITPLMMAMRYDHASTVKLLLDEGSDGYFRNDEGKNAADVARAAGNTLLANDFVERLNLEQQRKRAQGR